MTKLYCYIMSINHAFKIGVSNNPNSRLKAVRSEQIPAAMKPNLQLVAFWEGTSAEEHQLHTLLKDYRYHLGPFDEWFIKCNTVKETLRDYLLAVKCEKRANLHLLRPDELQYEEDEKEIIRNEFAPIPSQGGFAQDGEPQLWGFDQQAFLLAANKRFENRLVLARKLHIPEGQLAYIIGGWRPPRHLRIAISTLLKVPIDKLWIPLDVRHTSEVAANSPVDDPTENP